VLKHSLLTACLVLSGAVLFAQATPSPSKNDEPSKRMAADAHPVFEVVTIKPSEPGDHLRWWGEKGRHVFMNNARVVDLLDSLDLSFPFSFWSRFYCRGFCSFPNGSEMEQFLNHIPTGCSV
jgi:hypothetical protein